MKTADVCGFGEKMKSENDIKNALRFCADACDYPEMCKKCPYFTDKNVLFCTEELLKDSLELINQQQERIDIMMEGKEICNELNGSGTAGETISDVS